MADISTVTIPVGGSTATYNLKDSEARTLISNLQSAIEAIGSPLEFLGITTTTITDGDTTHVTYNSLVGITTPAGHDPNDVIDNGSVVISGQNEYVFLKTSNSGGTWYAFGSPSVTFGEYTVLGSNATFSATSTVSWSTPDTEYFVKSDSFDMSTGALPGADYDDYIGPLPKATKKTVVTGVASNGTVSAMTGLGINTTSTGGTAFVAGATVTNNGAVKTLGTPTTDNFVKSYSPDAQWLTVTSRKMLKASPSTTSITGISSVGSAPSWSATVTGENLAFTWNAGSTPTAASAVSVYASGQYDSGTTTFATGDMQSSTTGAGGGCFLTSLGTPSTGSAVTDVGTPTYTNVVTARTLNYFHPSTETVIKSTGLSTGDSITEADNTYLYWTKDTGITSTTGLSVSTSVTTNNKDQKTVYGPQTQP